MKLQLADVMFDTDPGKQMIKIEMIGKMLGEMTVEELMAVISRRIDAAPTLIEPTQPLTIEELYIESDEDCG